MTKKSFTRRSLLKGLGLGAAGLPFVPLLREGTARAGMSPKLCAMAARATAASNPPTTVSRALPGAYHC